MTNSYRMELAGLERCLETISNHNVFTKVLATDRHPAIQKMLRYSHKEIKHEYDLWHIQNGVKKKLIHCKIPELLVWVLAIVNHLWYCAATFSSDPSLLQEKWISFLHHITNRHHWNTGDKLRSCKHEPYTREKAKSRPWLKKSSKAFIFLQSIVLDKKLLKDIEKVRGIYYCHWSS